MKKVVWIGAALVVAVFGCAGDSPGVDVVRQAASASRIGPERRYSADADETGEQAAFQIPGKGLYFTSIKGGRRSVEWALSPVEQVELFANAPHGDHEQHGVCGRELFRRVSRGGPSSEQLHTSVYLHWRREGDALVVDRVVGADDLVMDEQAEECFSKSFLGEKMPVGSVPDGLAPGDFFSEWPICLRTGSMTAAASACWETYSCNANSRPRNCTMILPSTGSFRQEWERICTATPYEADVILTTLNGRGCDPMDDVAPGAIGAQGCFGRPGIINLGGGRCEVSSLVTVRGPGCCIVDCPSNLPGCRPELHQHE